MVSNDVWEITDQGLFDQDPADINVWNNYIYDELGQLITDQQEETEEIIWRVDGKISRVVRETISTRKSLVFVYDAMGNRIAKKVYSDNTFSISSLELITYYLRDASGNVMSIYEETTGQLNLTEQHIYGSSRLGMRHLRTDMLTAATPVHTGVKEIIRGERRYELTNHLGNVLVICSDQLTATDGDSNNLIDFYAAEVVSYCDYYPFGAPMDERTSGESRYGFNGKEQDNEFSGEGNTYDFGARMYDGRLGRWWSVDPVFYEFYGESTYQFAGSSPMSYVDIDGNFKIPAEVQKRYDKFYNYINNQITTFLLSSERIKEVLFKYSVGGLTPEEIKRAGTPDEGPTVVVYDFPDGWEGQLGEYHLESNTIRIDRKLVEHYEKIMDNENATEESKSSIAITLTSTFINEFTHYGDALDMIDAIEIDGEVVNGDPAENSEEELIQPGGFDEGNEAAEAIYPNTVLENTSEGRFTSGQRNYRLRKFGEIPLWNTRTKRYDYKSNDDSIKEKDPTTIPPTK